MPLPDPPTASPIEIVIPDCCNIGVVFRTLLAVNGFALLLSLSHTAGLVANVDEFVALSILLEPACLASLLALCGLRRIVRTVPPFGQRIACALVPAAVTGVVIHLIESNDLMAGSFSRHTNMAAMALAGLIGIVTQHYFELRARAFSPALAEARLQALQARIRPHFLFNSLNAVLSLIREEPKQAEAALEDLADLFRVSMRDARDIVTLEDEIRLCRQYLSIEKIRLGERLQVEWDSAGAGDAVLRKARVPALLLQPILENAVHFGVEPATEPVLIRIQIRRSIDRIEIAVINPVPDQDPNDALTQQGNRMALENIRQRLAVLHDVEAELTTALVHGRFEVRLRFPYVKSP